MKRILPAWILFPVLLSAQSQRQTIYLTTPDCYVQSFIPLQGGGNLLAGYAKYGSDSCNINLIFMNDSDVIVSHKEFNMATDFDFLSSVVPAGNGFMIGGKSSDPSFFHPQLIRTDMNGNVLWAKYFDNTSYWQGQIIRIIPNGTGFSMYTFAETPFNDFYRIETDANGSSFTGSQFTPDTAMSFRIFDAEQMPNSSSHILCGHANFNSTTTRGGLLMKTTPSGAQWARYISANGNFKNDIIDVTAGADGNSYSVFVCENLPGNQYSTIILKFDSLGNKVWAKQMSLASGTLNGSAIIESTAHDFYIASYDNLLVAYITKLDDAGNLVWTRKWTTSSAGGASALKLFKDAAGNIVFAGMLDNSYFVARLDGNGQGCSFINSTAISVTNANTAVTNVTFTTAAFTPSAISESPVYTSLVYSEGMLCGGVGISDPELSPVEEIFPNPANGFITIQSESEIRSIEILDIMGKQVMYVNPASASEKLTVDISALAEGAYFIRGECVKGRMFYKNFIRSAK